MTSEVSEMTAASSEEYAAGTVAAVGGGGSNLPMRKRKQGLDADVTTGEDATAVAVLEAQDLAEAAMHVEKKLKTEDTAVAVESSLTSMLAMTTAAPATVSELLGTIDHPESSPPMTKAREIRLEQNRKAARESRRRKKIMIEELQRSVIFFSRANSTLKQQNEELQRLLVQAQTQCKMYESNGTSSNTNAATLSTSSVPAPINTIQDTNTPPAMNTTTSIDLTANAINEQQNRAAQAKQAVAAAQAQAEAQAQMSKMAQQAQAQAAQAAATQAIFESQGFPPAAARSAAQTFVAAAPADIKVDDASPALVGNATNIAAATTSPATVTVNAANPWPFLMAMAPVANQPTVKIDNVNTTTTTVPAPAQVTAVSTTPAAATNTFQEQAILAMQQQFTVPHQLQTFAVTAGPALLQQQAAFMQQMMNFNNVTTTANGPAAANPETKVEDASTVPAPSTTTNV